MQFNTEYGDWFFLEELQRDAVINYGYESVMWKYIRDIKHAV